MMGHVHNMYYLLYMEEARTALTRDSGFPYEKVENLGIFFTVKKYGVEFFDSLFYPEEYTIETYFEYFKTFSMKIIYEIKNSKGITVAKGYTILASLSAEDRDFIEIPEQFRVVMAPYIQER